ncbi:MAG: DMT family transporter [Burkholderiaceae bacterium]|jgi:drug/metabolite transporter (DMT)-like permease|nr:DMT family transporter [Burkholderiaceae bacterium]
MTVNEKRWAILGLLVNAFVWGVSWWPLRQLNAAGFHPLWGTLTVFAPALLVVGLWYRQCWRTVLTNPSLWALALAAGATNVGFNWAYTTGDVIRVILLFYTMPAWAVLLAWWLLGERPTPAALFRLVIAFAGLWLVLWTPGSAWPLPQSAADVLALVAGFMFALNNVLLRRGRNHGTGARVLAMFFGAVFLNTLVAFGGYSLGLLEAPKPVNADWVPVALGLSLAVVAANFSIQYGAARLASSTTSVVMLSEVVFGSVSAIALGAAVFVPQTGVGALCIMTAAMMAALARQAPQPTPPSAETTTANSP